MLSTNFTLYKRKQNAPVQLTYACRAIMHDIGLVKTMIMVFLPGTVSSYSYIQRQPPVSSCAPDALNTLKMAKFCTVQLAEASRATMHDIRFVETIFMIFLLWTVSSYSYIKRLPPVSSCSPDAVNVLKTAKFCSSLIDLCHQSYHARYWVCRDYNYGVPTLDSVSIIIAISLPQFMTFRQHLILEYWPRNT